jgi:protein O-GlcNAc transferase
MSSPQPSTDDLFSQAVGLHQAGRVDEAAKIYEQILAQTPRQFDATHLLGVIALQQGQFGRAERLITAALEINPDDPGALSNLGTLHLHNGQLEAACSDFERAVQLQPDSWNALTNLGTVLRRLGRTRESLVPLRRAYAANPKSAAVCHVLGASLLDIGDAHAAVEILNATALAEPGNANAWSDLALALNKTREHGSALECADKALALNPLSTAAKSEKAKALAGLGDAETAQRLFTEVSQTDPQSAAAFNNLGVFFRDQGDLDTANKRFQTAVDLDPALAGARENLTQSWLALGRMEKALAFCAVYAKEHPESSSALAALAGVQMEQGNVAACVATYREAVGLPGASAQTHCAFANALLTSGQWEEAIGQFQQALKMDENYAIARWALAMAQCKPIYGSADEVESSRRAFAESIAALQTWFQSFRGTDVYGVVGTSQPFYLAYQPFNNKDLMSGYGALCAQLMTSMPSDAPTGAPAPGGKFRIGIASAHIREHSVWNAITKGWIRHLDKSRFELYLFQLGRSSDEETERAKREADHFEDRPKHLQAWSQAIRSAHLDALIYPEIGMDPLTTQLAAQRLSPVQAVAWGHPETTGLPTIDLYLSAEAFEPPQGQSHYSERLVCLSNLGVCVEPATPSVAAPDLASLGLPTDEPLLLCAGTPFKYSPMHDKVWAAIAQGLQAGTGGRLVFFRSHRESMNEMLERRLRSAFDREGVDFDARVCLIPTLDRPLFFGLMERAALMLDTLGFSGFNTALQAVECGLPVLAREGDFMRGRLASSIMRRMGMPELVATADEAFIQTAIRLAADAARCRKLRQEIANRRQILYHDVEPVRALERCLTEAIKAR